MLPVSDQAIYDKLRCMERCLSRPRLVAGLGGPSRARSSTPWAPAWHRGCLRLSHHVKVLDGNHLSATGASPAGASFDLERRRRPARYWLLYEQERDLVTQVFLTPDGHAQERSLLEVVLQTVQERDVWMADRNFCTLGFLFGLGAGRGCDAFVIRQHGNLPGRLLGKRRARGRTDTGRVYEQAMALTYAGETLQVRRVTVVLDNQPTRDGDPEIHIVTNLPELIPPGRQLVAELYRKLLDDREPLL